MVASRHVIEGYSVMLMTETELARQLMDRFRSETYEPPKLPTVAIKLMELSRDPNVAIPKVLSVLEQDQMMTGMVLKLANSAAYGGAAPIASLRDALIRLGLQTLRDVVMQAAMSMRVFRANGYADVMDALRRHSLATAYVAQMLARGHELAFLAGLMHDVGVAGCLLALGDVPRGEERPAVDLVWSAIEAVHEKAGVQMCRLWKLPVGVIDAVSNHHGRRDGGKVGRLAAIVCLADQIAVDCGYRITPDAPDHPLGQQRVDTSTPGALRMAREAMGMDDKTYRQVVQRAAQTLMEKIGDAGENKGSDHDPTPTARVTNARQAVSGTARLSATAGGSQPPKKRGLFGFGRKR